VELLVDEIRTLGERGSHDAVRGRDGTARRRAGGRGRCGGGGRCGRGRSRRRRRCAAQRAWRARRRDPGRTEEREDLATAQDVADRTVVVVQVEVDARLRLHAAAPVAAISTTRRISSTMLTTRKEEVGGVMPKSPNFTDGLSVAVALSSLPVRVATTSKVTSFVLPLMVRFPVSLNVNSPDAGSVRPLVFVGTSVAVGN